jgi:hypothetical protein
MQFLSENPTEKIKSILSSIEISSKEFKDYGNKEFGS